MECLLRIACVPISPLFYNTNNKRNKWLFKAQLNNKNDPLLQTNNKRNRWLFKAQLNNENDPLLQSAINSADQLLQSAVNSADPLLQSAVNSADPLLQSAVNSADPLLQSSINSADPLLQSAVNSADPLLQSAINSASIRFHETHKREPLFLDPYVGCFVPPQTSMDLEKSSRHYCIATKFIDDKLLRTVNHMDGLKQVVILSDGMDTRPYRLNWPSSTIIFDISPERVFQNAAEKLQGVGAKIPRSCLFLHVPLESSNIQATLRMKGFNGNRPSIWAIQGLPLMTLESFEEILLTVSGLAMNGCNFLGELPAWLAETEFGSKSSTEEWLDNFFQNNGFKVDMISYNGVAKSLGKEVKSGDHDNLLFIAEQLRFSEDQREIQRVEKDGDKEN